MSTAAVESSSSRALTAFQWGGSISALFLLILNRTGRRSPTQTNLLVSFLVTSFPTVLFKILRGQFGYWVAFLAVASHLFFPDTFPVSRFLLFVITPDWVAEELRDGIAGGVFCLIIGFFLTISWFRGIRRYDRCECSFLCFCYFAGIALLILFTILYLIFGNW